MNIDVKKPRDALQREARDRVAPDGRVLGDIDDDAHAPGFPRIDGNAVDPADRDAKVAHRSAFGEAGHAALEVDFVALLFLSVRAVGVPEHEARGDRDDEEHEGPDGDVVRFPIHPYLPVH